MGNARSDTAGSATLMEPQSSRSQADRLLPGEDTTVVSGSWGDVQSRAEGRLRAAYLRDSHRRSASQAALCSAASAQQGCSVRVTSPLSAAASGTSHTRTLSWRRLVGT